MLLDTDNYKAYLKDVPIHHPDFNQAFRDSFQIALDLGYSSIWIDSLCILQDSVEDWTEQCPRMAEIYSNSDCNLSATGIASGEDGMIGLCESHDCARLPLSANHTKYGVHELEDMVGEEPLTTRGWAIQEHAMVSQPRLQLSCRVYLTHPGQRVKN